ncbi:MAG: hypothetical protein NWF04_10365 [Candidatus Bathyarchaeota archaeon]|nr:hypothetical protein [Candidatus Bathyarchaeota archaeon]
MTNPTPQPDQKTWVFRGSDLRPIQVKAKNMQIRKIAAMDLATSLPFGLDVPEEVPVESVKVGQASIVRLKIYTAQTVEDVAPEYAELFKTQNADQPTENFLKAYWLYPKHIKFELTEIQQT